MRKATVYLHGNPAGQLIEIGDGRFQFAYNGDYVGPPISLTMPTHQASYEFDGFPPFFDGLLPEGLMLDALLRQLKIDRTDTFSQLCAVGADLVGAVTVEPVS